MRDDTESVQGRQYYHFDTAYQMINITLENGKETKNIYLEIEITTLQRDGKES